MPKRSGLLKARLMLRRLFHDRVSAAIEIKNWKAALSAIEEGINLNPDSIFLRRNFIGTSSAKS